MSTIIFSGDDGDTFTASNVTGDTASPIDLIRAGDFGPFFALRDHITGAVQASMLRSIDGAEWEEILDPLLIGGVSSIPGSLAYDFKPDVLYITYQSETYVFALPNASQVDVGQVNEATLAAGAALLTEGVPPYWIVLPRLPDVQRGNRAFVVNKKGRV